jgi:anti-sigma regulatory factor (Ser/Thr protein kinase)
MEAWTYELNPEITAVRPAASDFREWARRRIGDSATADCELALVEACNNLIAHNVEPGLISLRAEATHSEAVITIKDRTPGFKWPDEPTLPDAECERGRGIFLMHALMSHVEYHRKEGWNELRMRKRL